MNIFDEFLAYSNEIIGDRTPDEIHYDNEVLKWFKIGKNIRDAIFQANLAFPEEALLITDSDLEDLAAHYDFLLQNHLMLHKEY